MIALLTSVLAASVAGSPHCAGMCGGVALFCGGAGQCGARRSVRASALYHGARLVSYALAGAFAGGVGLAVDAGGVLVGVQHAAAIAAGLMVALVGVSLLVRARQGMVGGITAPAWIERMAVGLRAVAVRLPPHARSLAIGVLTPLLPCGWLWAFVAVAAGSGGALVGAAVMAAFWAGTLPALLLAGVGSAMFGGDRRRWASALAGVLMVVVGVHTAFVRGPMAARAVTAGPGVAMGAVAGEREDLRPPCCRVPEVAP